MKSSFQKLTRYAQWRTLDKNFKNQKLDEVLFMVGLVPETAALLEFAAHNNIDIRFDAGLALGSTHGFFFSNPKTGERYIALSPTASVAEIATTLAHELRHMWQYDLLERETGARGLLQHSPMARLLTIRMMEADAEAFATLYTQRFNDISDIIIRAFKQHKNGQLNAPISAEEAAHCVPAANLAANAQQYKEAMQRVFSIMLSKEALRSYDRGEISDTRYSLSFEAAKNKGYIPENIDFLRKMARFGLDENSSYLEDHDIKNLRKLLLTGVHPEARKTIRLADDFVKAAAKGVATSEQEKSLRQICRKTLLKI